MGEPILWQNEACSVTLIDVPRSIAAAQGTVQHPCHDQLLSSEPLQVSFSYNEPKSAAAKSKLTSNVAQQDLHQDYAKLCTEALRQAKAKWSGRWCLPRPFITGLPATKRRCDDEGQPGRMPVASAIQPQVRYRPLPNPDDDGHESILTVSDQGMAPSATLIANTNDESVVVSVSDHRITCAEHYRVPAGSSFCLGDCNRAQGFRAALREQSEQQDTPRTFDFILLDPPWPNRSVKRTHKTAGSTYSVEANLRDIEDLLLGMDLDMLMADECLVGVWITNKQAVRDLVLDEGGLFDSLGVQLVEEWIWLKTTVHGEPVTPLDALWRKPYEVLLLGRKRSIGRTHIANDATGVRRRTLIGVPDLHSRKPCLKALIRPLLPSKETYRALEVFARYLVAGFWSWGDECIKFNSEEQWKKSDRTPE